MYTYYLQDLEAYSMKPYVIMLPAAFPTGDGFRRVSGFLHRDRTEMMLAVTF